MKIKLHEATFILVANGKPFKMEYRYNQQDEIYELFINDKMIRFTGICSLIAAKAHLRRHINEQQHE